MKTLNFRKALTFLLVSFFFISCEKNHAPTCQFIEPADGYTVTKGDIVSIKVSAADDDGLISEVKLFIDEIGLAAMEFPYNFSLNTRDYRSGPYTLKVISKDDEGLEASDEIQLIIDATFSVVSTTDASDINYNSAVAGGDVSDDGGDEITETGVYWDTITSPETAGNKVSMGQGLGEFTGTLSELPHGRQIYYLAYAINSAGISLGEEFSFMTNTVPTVQTGNVQSLDFSSAVVNGEITSDGGEAITEKGIYWSTEPIAELTGTRLPIANDGNLFSTKLKDLSLSTTYYIKAFAANAAGESLGGELSFTTTGTASMITHQAFSDRYKTAMFSGEVVDNGGNEITETGFYFGTSSDPVSTGTRISIGAGTSNFTSTQENLTPGITYYFIAFAVNKAGESVGEQLSFELPEVEKGAFIDARDQEEYGTLKIGEQVWMSENLKATLYNDGSEILHVADSIDWSTITVPAYCWYDNNPQWEDRGALYNVYTVRTGKLCPSGWHIPSDEEWRQFEYYLGMEESVALKDGYRGNNEGAMLKTTTLWESPNTGATNELSFSAIPTGRRRPDGEFLYLNIAAYFWTTSTGAGNMPQIRILWDGKGEIGRIIAQHNNAFPLRCLKDE